MKSGMIGVLLLTAFVFVTLVGLPLLLSHDGHHTDCPLAAGSALCENTALEHVTLWQAMFASLLADLLLLCACLCVVFIGNVMISHARVRMRFRARAYTGPSLFQKLFSRGILNRKEPYLFS